MRYCIPDELFNMIPYPASGLEKVGIDGIYREVAYKLPGAQEVVVRREIWHSLVDFCVRLGVYLVRLESGGANAGQIALSSQDGKFMRVVGAEVQAEEGGPWKPVASGFSIDVGDGGLYAMFSEAPYKCAVVVSVKPRFDDETQVAGEWTPKVPQYIIDRYGECIAHGALTRLYAMRGDSGMARMHATAYNNDLNRLSFGLITSGMRKHLLIDVEDWLVNTSEA